MEDPLCFQVLASITDGTRAFIKGGGLKRLLEAVLHARQYRLDFLVE